MKFSQVAQVFEKIEATSSRSTITELLADGLQQMNPREAQIVTYLSMGDLYSTYENIQFNIADKGLVEIIAVLLHKNSAHILQEYKDAGDLGDVIQNGWHGADEGLSIE